MHPQRGIWLLIALLALLAAAKPILSDTLDPDCFWHLRVAEQLQRDGVGPIVDEISFASVKEPWTPYSWLAELGMKSLWETFGWQSAVAIHALMSALLLVLIALSCREILGEQSDLRLVLATVFAGYWCLPYLSFRPVTLAIVLIALCVWLLLRDRRYDEQSRGMWWLLPITLICANVHFFALLVSAIVMMLLLGSCWERDRRSIVRYAMLLLLTSACSLATPMLPGTVEAIVQYQFHDPTLSASFIAEFQPFYSGPLGLVSVALLVAMLAFVLVNRQAVRAGERLWLLLGLVLLLRLGRFAPVFAILSAPVLAATLPRFRSTVLTRPAIHFALASVLVCGLMRLAIAFPSGSVSLDSWLNRHGPDTPGYPTAAADFVQENVARRPQRILNEFTWGGYLAWRFGAGTQVLVDGRTQLYSPQFWNSMYGSRHEHIAAPLSGDAAILPLRNSRLRPVLISCGWRAVWRDDRAEVLVPGDATAGTDD